MGRKRYRVGEKEIRGRAERDTEVDQNNTQGKTEIQGRAKRNTG